MIFSSSSPLLKIAHETKLILYRHSQLYITTPKGGGFKNYNKGCKLLKTVIQGVVKIEFGISEEPVDYWYKLNIKNRNTGLEKEFSYKCKN